MTARRTTNAAGAARPWRTLALFALLVLWTVHLRGDESPAPFEEANRLYEQGQFREAAMAYERLLAGGRGSSAVHFNLGNAWFKAGELGRALVQYRLAERLAPRDPDIQANLRMARETANGAPPSRAPAWRRQLGRLTLNEWTLLFLVPLWTTFSLLAAGELLRARRGALRRLAALAGAVAIITGTCLAGAWLGQRSQAGAIVVAREAVVRYGPLEVSPPLQTVTEGAELEVLDRKDGWLNVAGLPRGTGWIQATNVVELPR